MRHGQEPIRGHDLSGLRAIGSSGETEPGRLVVVPARGGGGRTPIVNYSGGTEIGGGIVSGTTVEPMRPCASPARCRGWRRTSWTSPVRRCAGAWELVVRQPWVGMTQGFWGGAPGEDPQREQAARERYLETHWSRFPDTWVHGDWALVDDDGSWFLLGRSDDTIKVAGKRLGPAEVEAGFRASRPGRGSGRRGAPPGEG